MTTIFNLNKENQTISSNFLTAEIFSGLEKIKKITFFRSTVLLSVEDYHCCLLCKSRAVTAEFSNDQLSINSFYENRMIRITAQTADTKVLFYKSVFQNGILYQQTPLSPEEFFELAFKEIEYDSLEKTR